MNTRNAWEALGLISTIGIRAIGIQSVAVTLALTLVSSNILPAAAQGEPPPEPLERGITRVAPEREPIILETRPEGEQGTATILSIPAAADTYIASGRPNENFSMDALYLGYNFFGDSFGAQRILIRFDLDTIPDNAVINSARIRLRLAFSSPADDSAMNTVLRRVNSGWDETSVTWNNEPSWGSVRDSTAVGSSTQWYEWEVNDLVAGWINGTFANHGVEIIGDETERQRERAFYARETSSNFYPQLIVDYTVSADNSPPNVSVEPLPEYSRRNFEVEWSGNDVGDAGIDRYDVQYRVNDGDDDGDWTDWLTGVTYTSAEFPDGLNGRRYQFRARGIDNVGNVEPYGGAEASTIVDTLPPITEVDPLPNVIETNEILVRWQGDDRGGSGIVYYDVRVRYNYGNWEPWLQTTTRTSAIYSADRGDGVYEFEARAVDRIGFVEPFMSEAKAATVVDIDPPFIQVRVFMPHIGYRTELTR